MTESAQAERNTRRPPASVIDKVVGVGMGRGSRPRLVRPR